jgi:Fe-Mn family superoxide dismutase
MHTYEAKTFDIPELDGISKKSVDEHLGLYQGYVKNFNAMSALIPELAKDSEKNAHTLAEIVRRRSFEFGGMRLHELYFAQFEGGAKPLDPDSAVGKAIADIFEGIEIALAHLKGVGLMRGPGWSLLYYDRSVNTFHVGFSGEQHQGHFATLPVILALDVWEHAFLLDYGAQGKGKYIDAFFKNLNWDVVDKRFAEAKA